MGLLGTATHRAGAASGLHVKFNEQTVAGGAGAGQRWRTCRLHPNSSVGRTKMFQLVNVYVSYKCLYNSFHVTITLHVHETTFIFRR